MKYKFFVKTNKKEELNIKKIQNNNKNLWLIVFLKNHGLEKYTETVILIKEWTITIIYAFLLATIFKTFFYENFKIPSGSMNPLLLNGDRILVNKWYYGYSKYSFPFNLAPIKKRILSNHTPKRGDIIVFHTKFNDNIFYIKRIVGLPGDEIQIKDNVVYINDEEMKYKEIGLLKKESDYNHNSFDAVEYTENNGNKEYSILVADVNSIAGNTKKYIVPEDSYFCMGDNRDNSHDSRFPDFEAIPFKNVVGKAEFIFYSTANGRINFDRIFKKLS